MSAGSTIAKLAQARAVYRAKCQPCMEAAAVIDTLIPSVANPTEFDYTVVDIMRLVLRNRDQASDAMWQFEGRAPNEVTGPRDRDDDEIEDERLWIETSEALHAAQQRYIIRRTLASAEFECAHLHADLLAAAEVIRPTF